MLVRHETTIRTRVAAVIAAIFAISVLHQITPVSMLHWHNAFQHLYYLPIVFAGLSFGWLGGLATALLAALSNAPHNWDTWSTFSELRHRPALGNPPLLRRGRVDRGSGRARPPAACGAGTHHQPPDRGLPETAGQFREHETGRTAVRPGTTFGRSGPRSPQSPGQHRRRGRNPAAQSRASKGKRASAWTSSPRSAGG